jgi:NAD(P)-dependent dehydrogenase (short-subunit alcohol dehydrogenase family)
MSPPQPGDAVLVTGASTGVGRACALHLDRQGWLVFAGVRRREDGQELAAEASDRLEPLVLDITKANEVHRATEEIAMAVDGRGLTGLVNNAGLFVGGPLELLPLDELRRQLEVDLIGQVAVTQALLPLLRQARGRILFVTSVGGRITTRFAAPYHASKWGLEAVADAWRGELAPFGIEVATIEPGIVATEIRRNGAARGNAAREDLGEEGERLYGAALDAFRTASEEAGKRGIAAERVAEVVEDALVSRRPRSRYLVGGDAKAVVAARNVLGPRRFNRFTRRVMRLP